MKLSHKQKVSLAKKLITPKEKKEGVSIFSSKAWEARKHKVKPIFIEKKVVKKTLWDKVKSLIHRILTATFKRV